MSENDFKRLIETFQHTSEQFIELVEALAESPDISSPSSWGQPLREWWNSARHQASPEITGFYQNLVDHGLVLFRIAEQLNETATNQVTDKPELAALLEEFQKSLANSLTNQQGEGQVAASPMNFLIETWRKTANALLGMSGNLAEPLKAIVDASDWTALADALSGSIDPGQIAGASLSRSDMTQLVNAASRYQEHYNRLAHLSILAARDAMLHLESDLGSTNRDESRGVRELYASWLANCEKAYDERVKQDEFAQVFAGLINSAVELRTIRTRLSAYAANALGLPTRDQIRDIARVTQANRRMLRRIQREQSMIILTADTNSANPITANLSNPESVDTSDGDIKVTGTTTKKKARKVAGKATNKMTGKPTSRLAESEPTKSVRKKSAKKIARKATPQKAVTKPVKKKTASAISKGSAK